MEFKPGDILYRKYSDKNDLYCVLAITKGPFNIGPNVKLIRMVGYYSITRTPTVIDSEVSTSIKEWYIKADLNNYDIKDKFLKKIKEYLIDNLGKTIHYDLILDNLLYIEILVALKKYETSDIVESEE